MLLDIGIPPLGGGRGGEQAIDTQTNPLQQMQYKTILDST